MNPEVTDYRMLRTKVPNWRWRTGSLLVLIVAVSVWIVACSRIITPAGEPAERHKAAGEEGVFAKPVEKRPIPDLTTSATLPRVLEFAFNANGDIESAYRDWRAAIERVPQAGALPDPRLDFKVLFDVGNLQSFSGVLKSVSMGLSQDIPRKGKRVARADLALAQAQAAGEKFRGAKYQLQRKVVTAYAQVALNESMAELTSESLRLLQDTYDVSLHRYHAMADGGLSDVRKIDLEIEKNQTDQRQLTIARDGLVAELNGALNRPATSRLSTLTLPVVKYTELSAVDLFARAVASNPELAALRKDIEARGAAQVLAELEKKPDYTVSGEVEYKVASSSVMPSIGLGMTLPINRARIRAGIAEALAMRQSAEAQYRAAESNVGARLVIALTSIRDARRILDDYREEIIPTAKELLDTQLSTYGSGSGDFLTILDTERLLIDFQKLVLQAEADLLRFHAELEEIVGEDLYRFVPAAGAAEAAK